MEIKSKSNYLFYSISFVILYVYIFAPPFRVSPFGIDKYVWFIAIIYITITKKWRNLYSVFKKEHRLLLLIFIFSFVRGFLFGEITYFMYDFFLWGELITCSYFLYMLIDKNRGLRLDKIMITSSIVASFISIYLILNPDLALYLKQFVLKYPENLIEKFYFRGYGFSDGLFFAYPVILGFCAGMIIMGINQKKIFVACLFPMLIAIFANARSGLVPIFVSIILVILFNFRNFINNTFFISLALLLLSGIIMTFIRGNELLNTSFEWGLTSFGIFSGEDDGNLSALLGDMLVFPQNMQDWLFGSGEFIFTDHKYTTDIGYLLRLNFGGIFYSLLFFVLIFYMFFRLLKINKYIAYLLFISLIYCHFKGDFFIVNPSSRFFFFVYSVSILNPNCFKPFWTLKTTLTLK